MYYVWQGMRNNYRSIYCKVNGRWRWQRGDCVSQIDKDYIPLTFSILLNKKNFMNVYAKEQSEYINDFLKEIFGEVV